MVMKHRKKGTEAYSEVMATLIGPNEKAVATIVKNPGAIAYVSIGLAERVAARRMPLRLLSLNGVPASIANVRNETYALRRPLHVVTAGPPQGYVKNFIDFLTSAKGQKIVAELDFVPLAAVRD